MSEYTDLVARIDSTVEGERRWEKILHLSDSELSLIEFEAKWSENRTLEAYLLWIEAHSLRHGGDFTDDLLDVVQNLITTYPINGLILTGRELRQSIIDSLGFMR